VTVHALARAKRPLAGPAYQDGTTTIVTDNWCPFDSQLSIAVEHRAPYDIIIDRS
jgi:hypothetical protein